MAVPPLTSDELERAITAPRGRSAPGSSRASSPTSSADVANQPGALPLVEFALTELFERRDDTGTMTLASYREIGGVAGALATRAEHLFGAMGRWRPGVRPQVLLRLVTLGEGREDTRRRVTRAELAALELDIEDLDGCSTRSAGIAC